MRPCAPPNECWDGWLSAEGRLEADGTLACSYHGWRFAPDGKCTAIPQATDKKAEQTACASSRSAATTYPVQVRVQAGQENQPRCKADLVARTGLQLRGAREAERSDFDCHWQSHVTLEYT